MGTVAVALLLAVTAAFAAGPDEFKAGEFIPLARRQPAPEVAFTDIAGNPATLADFKGKLLLVNLWATWCQPCLREMPSLEKLQAGQGDQLTVVAISEDRGGRVVGKVEGPAEWDSDKLISVLGPLLDNPGGALQKAVSQPGR